MLVILLCYFHPFIKSSIHPCFSHLLIASFFHQINYLPVCLLIHLFISSVSRLDSTISVASFHREG